MIDDYIVKGSFPNKLKIDTFSYNDLLSVESNRLNTIVAIRDVQFADGAAGAPYSAPAATTNRDLTDCSFSGGIITRTSNYAKFQSFPTPTGSGLLVALYTSYRGAPQLIIRDTSDLHLYNPRCE